MESVLNAAAIQNIFVEIVFVNSAILVTVLTAVHATHHVEPVPVNSATAVSHVPMPHTLYQMVFVH